MKKKYIVKLTEEERTYLAEKTTSGIESASSIRRAWVLLKEDQGEYGPAWSDQQINKAYEISPTAVYQIRKRYHQRGLKGTVARKKPDRVYERCLDGEAEAHLIAMVCSEAPEGYERWTLRLLRDEMVALEYVESVSHETI